jgi:hypothetical protein
MAQRAWVGIVAAWTLAAGVAQAQSPQPTGMLSPTRPFFFTNDGVPDGVGDVPGTIMMGAYGNVTPFAADFGSVPCFGQTQFLADGFPSQQGGIVDQFGRGAAEVTVGNFDTSDPTQPRPTNGHYDELGGGGPVQGDFDLSDSDGDHRYENAHVLGADGGGPVQADLDIVPADADNDGEPDHVTLTNIAVLDFFGVNCVVNGTPTDFDQVWFPLARDLDGDFAIIADLDGDGEADPELAWGPKLQLGSGPRFVGIPTLSNLGLAALTLILLGVGVHLLRRRETAAGG